MNTRTKGQSPNDRTLVTTQEAAAYLSLPGPTLVSWRHLKRGPAYIRLGRLVRYRVKDLQDFVQKGRQQGGAT